MLLLLFLSLFVSPFEIGSEIDFTASTPANNTVREFLGISQNDSIDFIRWQLTITDRKQFDVVCTYGIGKPNTNGFINGKVAEYKGTVEFNEGTLTLKHGDKILSMLALNQNVLHLLNKDGTMMVGNGGWSYTLNSTNLPISSQVELTTTNASFRDSIVFEGRTPCRGIEELLYLKTRPECYKKKWLVYLYKDAGSTTSGTYKIGKIEPKIGRWKLKENNLNRPIYSLDLGNGNTLDLLHADNNIVYIMDTKGGIMVGDQDFSYSLNRRIR